MICGCGGIGAIGAIGAREGGESLEMEVAVWISLEYGR